MTDDTENKVLTPEETTQELVNADPKQPLVPGHRDKKVIFPLAVLQREIKGLKEANAEVYNRLFQMMQQYGPASQMTKQHQVLIETMDIAYTVMLEYLREKLGLTDEEFKKRVRDTGDRRARERDEEEDKAHNRVIVEKKAEKGDTVCFDFKGTFVGEKEPFEGGEAKRFNLVIGSNAFIPGLEDQLIGVEAGQDGVIMSKFPENYRYKPYAGKEASFDVHIYSVKQIKKEEKKSE